jgi:hypothetical protein
VCVRAHTMTIYIYIYIKKKTVIPYIITFNNAKMIIFPRIAILINGPSKIFKIANLLSKIKGLI